MKTVYICDYCGKMFTTEAEVLDCEKIHSISFEDIKANNQKKKDELKKVNEALENYKKLKEKYDEKWAVKSLSCYNGKYYADGKEVDFEDYSKWLTEFFFR